MKWFNLLLLAIFLILRTLFDPWVRTLSPWTAYTIEGTLVLIFIFANWRHLRFRFTQPHRWKTHLGISLLLGAFIALAGTQFNLDIPFDFAEPELWLQLVIVAPLLEEALFRLLTWNTLAGWIRRPRVLIMMTATLFALAHYSAILYVPEDFAPFVIYQTVYTGCLGIYWGYAREKTGSWLAPAALHLAVNLTFGITNMFWASI